VSDALLKRLVKLAGAGALARPDRFDPADPAQVDRAGAALLERFYRENDTAAFELLVEISQPLLGQAALQITREVGLAVAPGELVSEYFSKLFVDLRQPSPKIGNLTAAAAAAMQEEATRRVRTLARRIRSPEDAAGVGAGAAAAVEPGAPGAPGAEAGAKTGVESQLTADQRLAGRFAALVSMCFHNLDEADRRLLLALEIDRLSYSEIAERLGIYQDEVAERIRYARGRLAARIAAVFAALQPKEDGP
jgi:RNA polymerase sigma factor (sigma-70 family)